MPEITAILLDTEGVLYHRPRQDRHLTAFLQQHGLHLRHRSVVQRALRAAIFDVQSGRITRDAFYDASLRVYGVADEALFPAGREALLRDAADIELYPGVRDTLMYLYQNHYRLGAISDTPHSAREKVTWMAARGVPPMVWDTFMVSSEVGTLKISPEIFERALLHLGTPADGTAFVGHNTDELQRAAELGMMTIAFLPDDPTVQATHRIGSFYELQDLFVSEEDTGRGYYHPGNAAPGVSPD
jgi:FMN phosphatase YigB (HAD superfamily)